MTRCVRALVGGVCILVATAAAQRRSDPLRGLDAYVEQSRRLWRIPGLAIAIVRNDSIVYARGFGVRELGKPDQVDTSTIFAVASHTKAFTATALAMLVGEHKLTWDDPVSTWLPWFQLNDPWATRELTVRDLLTHRMGYETWGGDLAWYGSTYDTREVLGRLRFIRPSWSFRYRYGYSNYGFIAAGEVLAAASGRRWDEVVRERILTPLHMTRTTTSVSALAGMADVATPHTRIGDSVVTVPYRNVDNAPGAAALNASVADMSRWVRFQLANGVLDGARLVDSNALLETRTPQMTLRVGGWTRSHFPSTHFLSYGFGWFLRDYRGRLLVMHDGGMDGMLSQTGFMPEEHWVSRSSPTTTTRVSTKPCSIACSTSAGDAPRRK